MKARAIAGVYPEDSCSTYLEEESKWLRKSLKWGW